VRSKTAGDEIVGAWINFSLSLELSRRGLRGLPFESVISYQYLTCPRSMLIKIEHGSAQLCSLPRSGNPASDNQIFAF